MHAMFAEVLLNLPVDKPFSYRVPDGMEVAPGTRVTAPFRGKPVSGFVFRVTEEKPPFPVKPLETSGEVLLQDFFFDLGRWMADRYACAWGEALHAMVPTGVNRAQKPRIVRHLTLVEGVLPESIRGPRQRLAVEILRETGTLPLPALVKKLGSRPDVKGLVEKGIVTVEEIEEEPDLLSDFLPEKEKVIRINADQQRALDLIAEHPKEVVLLHGVTGSGKTEVYLRAMERVVSAGGQAIVLVPEIALTPQTVSRFRKKFPRTAVLHSILSESERAAHWRSTRSGEAQVIIGARSAVFAPTKKLGLIVIDEEHEGAYKQENVPRYHAREVALERARQEGAGVILGSATPSLESIHRVREGNHLRAVLPERIHHRALPEIRIVDMAEERADVKRSAIFSRLLLLEMGKALKRGEQVLLFLNRRGFVTQIRCPRCAWIFRCRRCQVAMTHHRKEDRGRCHYCFESRPVPETCPDCMGGGLLHFGVGTERIEEEIQGEFPDRTIARMDSDVMKSRKNYRETLGRLWSGEIDVLVGTQMIAKGLDVPNVTVVGVISADTAFYVPDFRAAERTFQLITQVAGRAGRGPKGGTVLVQTFNPQHYAITAAAAYDSEGFLARELEMRKELGYPPFSRLVRILVRGFNEAKVLQEADRFAVKLRSAVPIPENVLGPAPAPLYRLKGRFRVHILLKAKDPGSLLEEIRRLLPSISGSTQAVVDVDPVGMM